MNSNYYIPQDASARSMIQSIWQVDCFPSFHTEYIVPKGIVEVIFNFSDAAVIDAQLGNKQYHLGNCFINGFNKSPIRLQLPKQQLFFGIIFHPLAIKKIFKVPAGEFSDSTVDLAFLDPDFNSLWQQLAEQDHFNKRVSVFLGWLQKKLIDWQPQEQLMNHFFYGHNRYDQSVNELADLLCYSPRHLSRRLYEATGMNTEEILLYRKYLHAVNLIHQSDLSLTEIAYQCNFSDQSHFIKTFKSYTQITPGEYQRNMSYVKGHIYKDVR